MTLYVQTITAIQFDGSNITDVIDFVIASRQFLTVTEIDSSTYHTFDGEDGRDWPLVEGQWVLFSGEILDDAAFAAKYAELPSS